MEDNLQKVFNELREIKIDIEFIKESILREDTFLDKEDRKAIKEYEKEKRKGLLVPLDSIRCLK